MEAKILQNAAAASISMLFIVVAVLFGLYIKYAKPNGKLQFVIGIILFNSNACCRNKISTLF